MLSHNITPCTIFLIGAVAGGRFAAGGEILSMLKCEVSRVGPIESCARQMRLPLVRGTQIDEQEGFRSYLRRAQSAAPCVRQAPCRPLAVHSSLVQVSHDIPSSRRRRQPSRKSDTERYPATRWRAPKICLFAPISSVAHHVMRMDQSDAGGGRRFSFRATDGERPVHRLNA